MKSVKAYSFRDQQKDGKIKIEYIESKHQLAVSLIKSISTKLFHGLIHQADIRNVGLRGVLEDTFRYVRQMPTQFLLRTLGEHPRLLTRKVSVGCIITNGIEFAIMETAVRTQIS